MKLTKLLAASALGLGLGLTAMAAQADTLKVAVGFPPGSASAIGMENFAKYIEANSDLKVKVFPLSLLNLKETPPGLRDGIADIGYVLTPYYPAEYAETNLGANLPMLVTTGEQVPAPGAAMAGAMLEYVMLNCPDCLAEHKRQNQVYLGGAASTDYVLLCTNPIRTLDDVKGKKIRSGAANFGRWAEHFGATKVSIPGNDIYEAMSQGVIDCAMISAPELTNLQLMDVTKDITLRVPGGVFAGSGTSNVNRDTWMELTPDQRKVMFEAAARLLADISLDYNDLAKKNIADAKAKGIEVIEPPADMLAASEAFVKGDMDVIAEQFTSAYGLENVPAKIDTISALVEKWKGLTKDGPVTEDREALAKLYWDQVFSKVDPGTYATD